MTVPRIALVDDDPVALERWSEALVGRGELHRCSDPLAARQSFDQEPFELVVLDLDMPGCQGLSLLKHLRRVQPTAEAIVVSSAATTENVVATMRLGACDFLGKPLASTDVLVHCIDEALARVRVHEAEDEAA